MNSTWLRARGAAIRSMIAALLLALVAGQSAGCGQRGPLYLPEPEPAADVRPAEEETRGENGAAGEPGPADPADEKDRE